MQIPTRLFKRLHGVEEEVRRTLARIDRVPPSEIILPRQIGHRLRLLNLLVWSQRYGVKISYILEVLLMGKYSRVRERNGKGRLGVGVPTLCGRASEKSLQEILVTTPHASLSSEIFQLGIHTDIQELQDPVRAYTETMRKRRLAQEQRVEILKNSPRSWRNRHFLY